MKNVWIVMLLLACSAILVSGHPTTTTKQGSDYYDDQEIEHYDEAQASIPRSGHEKITSPIKINTKPKKLKIRSLPLLKPTHSHKHLKVLAKPMMNLQPLEENSNRFELPEYDDFLQHC